MISTDRSPPAYGTPATSPKSLPLIRVWLGKDLEDFEVEKVVHMRREDDQGGVCPAAAFAGATDSDRLIKRDGTP